jgi:hypothetical protein
MPRIRYKITLTGQEREELEDIHNAGPAQQPEDSQCADSVAVRRGTTPEGGDDELGDRRHAAGQHERDRPGEEAVRRGRPGGGLG